MAELSVKSVPGGVTLPVRVTPRANKTQIAGEQDGVLKIKLAAPPVEGAANTALCEFLAGEFGLRKSAVTLVTGHTSRHKVVRLEGITADQVQSWWNTL